MSLEQAIEKLTTALERHTAVIEAAYRSVGSASPAPAATPVATATKSQNEAAPTKAAQQTARATPAALDYEKDVKPATLKLAAKIGREALLEFFAAFGIPNAKALEPEQYGKYLSAVNAKLAEVAGD